jgi:thioredoxin
MVKEITGSAEFQHEIRGPGLVVVDFFTTWCGPCKMIAPVLESLATKYPEVKFIKVDIEKNEDIAGPLRISSIPTFHFYVNGSLKDEMKGANPSALEQKIVQYKVNVNPFGGSGQKLQSDPAAPTMSAREARLKQFAALETKKPTSSSNEGGNANTSAPAAVAQPSAPAVVNASTNSSASEKMDVDMDEEEALAQALAISTSESPLPPALSASEQEALDREAAEAQLQQDDDADLDLVPVPVDPSMLAQLTEMGFSDTVSRKSIVHGKSLEGALTWIDEHQDDPDLEQPYLVRRSDAQPPKPPRTAEEKAQAVAALQEKIKLRREDRAKQEKAEEIRREKERRERGQKMDETLEERQRIMRKREAERLKKEKEDAAKERARLKAEIARDKEIRKMHGGMIPSVLGVEGYNPSAIQYDQPNAGTTTATSTTTTTTTTTAVSKGAVKPTAAASNDESSLSLQEKLQRIDGAIGTISRYRTGGDGGQALKLLLTFTRNIVTNPGEEKYRSINMDSAAFKNKLAPLVGPMAILKLLGFQKDDAENKLKFEG